MDLSSLVSMNLEMPHRENVGDRVYFDLRLAPSFSMRTANGAVVDRARYLDDLKSGGERVGLPLAEVSVFGQSRALVACQVRGGVAVYDNIRLFVREVAAPDGWLLLSSANEPVVPADGERT